MSIILTKIRAYIKKHPKGYKKLKKNLINWMLMDNTSNETRNSQEISQNYVDKLPTNSVEISNGTQTHPHKIRHAKSRHLRSIGDLESGTIYPNRHESDIRKNSESGEDGAFEDLGDAQELQNTNNVNHSQLDKATKQTPTSIWEKEHSLHTGHINMTDINDGSDSESESSYSSSEEALAKCEGIIGNFNLIPFPQCGIENGDQSPISLYFNATVNVSGYYYFIFGSENEKRDNFIQAVFELEKYEYQLPQPMENCTDVKECLIDFKFWSSQRVRI